MNSNALFKILFPLLLVFNTALPSANSQNIECEDHLEFCSLGWNKIYMEDDPGSAFFYFVSSNWSSSSTTTEYEYPYFYFLVNNSIPSSGTYRLTNDGINTLCTGTYNTNVCHDFLLFEGDNYCWPNFIFKPKDPFPVYLGVEPFQVCLGDTSHVYLSPTQYQSTSLPNAPFTADRLKISKGYLIDVKEYTFSIVWDVVGPETLELTTTDECGFQLVTFQEIGVKEKNEIGIVTEDGSSIIDICVGESVFLDSDLGVGNSGIWRSSDGRIFNDKFIDIEFDLSGQYTITLEDNNKCNCSKIDEVIVNVLTGESPNITCTGTICENTSVTYYSEDFCGSYLWSISGNGTITDGGGVNDYYISIDWGTGPEGIVELETPGCFITPCRESINKKIPIIRPNSTIDGPDLVCSNESNSYTIPYYAGTTYKWSVKEYFMGGHIGSFNGQGSNKILVNWGDHPNGETAIIEVEYENCTLGCAGYAELIVNILPRMEVSSDNSFICINENITATEKNGLLLNYEVISPSGGVTNFIGISMLSFPGNEEGTYTLTATNPSNTTCNLTEILKVNVVNSPPLPNNIISDGLICTGENSKFRIDGLASNHSVKWTVYDGDLLTPTLTLVTKELNYVWKNSEPFKVEAQLVDIQTGCIGEAVSEQFTSTIEPSGDDEICKLLEGMYTLSNPDNASVMWSILPDTSGVIIDRSNSELTVLWGQAGNHQILAEVCGIEKVFTVDVVDYQLDLIYPDSVCINEEGALLVNAPQGSTIEWFNENDSLIESGANVMLGKGDYSVVVNTPSNCIDGGEFSIYEFEEFEVTISADGPTILCPPDFPTLHSSAPPGTYNYEWYLNDVLLSETSSSLSTGDFGWYYVIATNQNGCKDKSNLVLLTECCGDSYIISCDVNEMIIDTTFIDCFEREFEVTNMNMLESDSIFWDFGDTASPSNYAFGASASHVFSGVGNYTIVAYGNKGCGECFFVRCGVNSSKLLCEQGIAQVKIYTLADFKVDETCMGEDVVIYNETTKISGYNDEVYSWNFGDPTSADNTSSDVNPSHIYASAGTYTITLVVTDHIGCSSSSVKEVIVHPKPIVNLIIPDVGCQGAYISFGATSTFPNLKYEWNFGDDNSGFYNQSKDQNPTHVYTKTGVYNITLEVESEEGCIESYSHNLDIEFDSNLGEISAIDGLYKCPGESITLTAPTGESYLWNTQEVTQSIMVVQEGDYEVAVTTNAGCEFTTEKAIVSDIDLTKLKIYGVTSDDGIGAVIHFDSMQVCKGEYFVLEVQQIQEVIFTWSIGNTEAPNLAYYEDGLNSLVVGRHEVTVTARHKDLGCDLVLEPFIINIIDVPEDPVIVSNGQAICNDGTTILSVVNPLTNYTYVWNKGETGTSIVASNNGSNYVWAYSPFGCRSKISNQIYVNTSALISPWIGGCHEVCFPYTICINLYQSYTYELIRNETEIIVINSSSTEIIINDPGDYELVAITSNGCRSKSEMLTLDALPEDQDLSGIVYYDENTNGTYESSDSLLADIPVILCNGNTPVDTTLTDINGNYAFDSISYPNLIVKLDLSNTPYANEMGLGTLVIFSECIESKEVDFPLVSECFLFVFEELFYVCEGSSIQIDGIDYVGGDKDTLIYNRMGECDSIIYLSVDDLALPTVTIDESESCINTQNGFIDIEWNAGDSLLFRIDENAAWVSDTIFDNLEAGSYDLFILSKEGCLSNLVFEIDAFPIPELDLTTFSSCQNSTNGSVDIFTASSGTNYSLDGNSTFTSDTHFENLSIGSHTIDFMDENGCIYQEYFEIEPFESPDVNLITISSCKGIENGVLNIDVLIGDNLTFSIDGGVSFSTQTTFVGLSPGSYILDIIDGNACAYQRAFEVEVLPETSFEIEPGAACIDIGTGSLSIMNASDDMQYSIDDQSNWDEALFYEGLAVGSHVIYSQSKDGCLDTLFFEIEFFETPTFNFEVKSGCVGIIGGELNIQMEGIYLIALDNNDFTDQFNFTNLTPGSHVFLVMTEEGCIFEYPFEVLEIPQPEMIITTNPSCFEASNGSATLSINNSNYEVLVYTSEGEEVDDLDSLVPGEYSAIATNDYNCEYTYPFTILELEQPFLEVAVENTCMGEDGGVISIVDRSENSMISLNGGEFDDVSLFENLGAGIYEIEVMDSLLCSVVIDVEVTSFDELIVEVPIETGECFGKPVLVSPEIISHYGKVDFLWNDGSTQFEKLIDASEKVSVTVSDQCGSKTFEFEVEISGELVDEMVYIPNIFSPNRDGINDCFQVTIDPSISLVSYHQIIFDRWGNKMFESDDIQFCWDGLFKGVDPEEGVYVYITKVVGNLCEGRKTIRKVGDVTIIK